MPIEKIFVVLFLISAILLIYVDKQRKKLEEENNNLEKIVENGEVLYRQAAIENRNLREIKHDYKCQLQISEEYEKIINENMQEDDKSVNLLVDLILKTKQQEAYSKGINLNYSLNLNRVWHITKGEVISLFANLLDNAIEAAEKVKENPFVCIDIKDFEAGETLPSGNEHKKNISIILENSKSYIEAPLKSKMATTKTDVEEHGFGTGIIKRIVEDNKGTINMEDKGASFLIKIHI